MSDALKECPKCECPYAYYDGVSLYVCPDCQYEWNPTQTVETTEEVSTDILDANGNILADGDTVVIVKDLPVKGASGSIKVGTKVKNIRLTDGDHNIDCKIKGFGSMGLKSEFVKKV